MSLGRSINHWGTNPGDAIDAALAAIETALQDLLATDPADSVRAHAELALADESLHDPEAAAVAFRMAAHALHL